MVKLDRRYDVGYQGEGRHKALVNWLSGDNNIYAVGRTFCDIVDLSLVSEALGKAPWPR